MAVVDLKKIPINIASINQDRFTYILLGLAILLTGIAHIAFLPPFEGFDEIGHYSYIREIVDTGKLPIQGKSHLAQEIIDYRHQAPIHYIVDKKFFKDESITYADFFKSKELQDNFRKQYLGNKTHPLFQPSEYQNWIAIHPPLYYLILSPIMMATDSLSLKAQFFVLRSISFLLALSGLMIAWRSTLAHAAPNLKKYINKAFFLYPIIVPMFFVEFGRVGSDSLCLFLLAIAWGLFLEWLKTEQKTSLNLALGFCLALGLLTKGFFIPIIAGFGAFAACFFWNKRKQKEFVRAKLNDLIVVSGPVFFAFIWYILKLSSTGSLVGHPAFIEITEKKNILQFITQDFEWMQFIKHILHLFISWTGIYTQSCAKMPMIFFAPPVVLCLALFSAYFLQNRKRRLSDLACFPCWVIAPMAAGLLINILAFMALYNSDSATPGWYLHILAPAFAMMFAYSFLYFAPRKEERAVIFLLLLYSPFYFAINLFYRISLYAGCSTLNDNREYIFPNAYLCLDQVPLIFSNLELLGWPFVGLILLIAGTIISYAGLWRLERISKEKSN